MKKVILYAPQKYIDLSKEEKKRICNGCGGRGGKINFLIPQKEFRECCNIHDFMYETGITEDDKRKADRLFIYNMNEKCKSLSGLKKFYYKQLAKIFYKSVVLFGDYYFWKNKALIGAVGFIEKRG